MTRWSQRANRSVVEAVVAAFHLPASDVRHLLVSLELRDWRKSYFWLDASGVALYLLERLEKIKLTDSVPAAVLARLQQNQVDNRERTAAMFAECTQLNIDLQAAGIQFCNLKGFTLTPDYCSDPSLRRQIDFDLLVDGSDLKKCQKLLEEQGYVLRGSTSDVWEFKTHNHTLATIADFYKPGSTTCVEVHFKRDLNGAYARDARLDRLRWIASDTTNLPALSPVDQFLGQAMHLFTHLCGHSTRLACVLEFSRYLRAHYADIPFWHEVRKHSSADMEVTSAVGVSCMMANLIFRTAIPPVLIEGTILRLPRGVADWVLRYGRRALLSDVPGTKLNLLLLDVLHADDDGWASRKRAHLLPKTRSPRILPLAVGATPYDRIRSEIYQLRYDLFRLRFHLTAGFEYAVEFLLWRSGQASQLDLVYHQPNAPQRQKS